MRNENVGRFTLSRMARRVRHTRSVVSLSSLSSCSFCLMSSCRVSNQKRITVQQNGVFIAADACDNADIDASTKFQNKRYE